MWKKLYKTWSLSDLMRTIVMMKIVMGTFRERGANIQDLTQKLIFHISVWVWFSEAKNQFVKAIKRYGLATKRSINFLKSEEVRVRAKCGWPGCPWLVYGAKTSRCSRFQIITYEDEHHCAQNRENGLVSAKVIAERYEHFILAKPMWKIDSIRATVLKDMFADVPTSKCKAAKKIVMDKLMSGMKSEYTKIFDYQLELLRSNPRSTVAVCLDPKEMEINVFQQFYVCFNALKQNVGIILLLVDTLNNDIIIGHINIFSSLCYSELLSGWITNTNSPRRAIKAHLKVRIPHLGNSTLSP